MASAQTFKFRKHDRIGAAAAEEDGEYLEACFVDTGDLDLLLDIQDSRQIILGRTGAGKSALLTKVARRFPDRVVSISPENLALTYVANSTILSFFAELGVNLDPFFKLLWRHVLTVEVLQHHLAPIPREGKKFIDRILEFFPGTSRTDKEAREAVEYMRQWGERFWEQTEYRIREITGRVEKELADTLSADVRAKLGIAGKSVAIGLKGGAKQRELLTEEQRMEVRQRGQTVVARAQVQDLTKIRSLPESVAATVDQAALAIRSWAVAFAVLRMRYSWSR